MSLLIYGAYGYTGELIAREAVKRGLRPILAGRKPDRLGPLADVLGLEQRSFSLEEAERHLDGVKVVLNCAGPFSQTAVSLTEACIARGVHYLDVSGEIDTLVYCHSRHVQARNVGVVLCPGAGFDVVPSDCLAATLHQLKPDAITLNLAFSFGTRPSVGTAKTAIEGLKQGGMIRRNHELVRVADGYSLRMIPFVSGRRWTASVPFGDVFTAGVTTQIPNVTVYSATSLVAGIMMKIANPLRRFLAAPVVQRTLTRLVEAKLSGGPDAEARAKQRTEFWGEAVDREGDSVELRFTAPNVYTLTTETALRIVEHCMQSPGLGGYYTPSSLMGRDFIWGIEGVSGLTESA